MKERIARAAQSARPALHVDAAIFAEWRAAEAGKVVEVKIDVVGDHQIHEAVAVIVAKGCAGRPAAVGDAGFRRYIGECAVAVVAIEDIAAEAGDIKIGPAVVVVVADRSAHGEAGGGQSGLCGHIGKCAVVIVVIKHARLFSPLVAISTVGALVK